MVVAVGLIYVFPKIVTWLPAKLANGWLDLRLIWIAFKSKEEE